jgi:hypothetical protein
MLRISLMIAQANDKALLALEKQLNALIAELAVVQRTDRKTNLCGDRSTFEPGSLHLGDKIKQAEAILARLDPIEREIMHAPACTIAGLGVKARHAAFVMSEYWEGPVDQIDWDAQAVRLLIEAICDVAGTPLPFRTQSPNLRGA